jgi:hypothetical protein
MLRASFRGGGLLALLVAIVVPACLCGPAVAGVYGPALRAPGAGEVASAQELISRARDPASDGKTFLVRGGDYGEVDLRGVRRRRLVTFKARPGERPVFGYTTMGNTQGVRLQGLRFVGGIDIQPGENARIQLVGNDIGGYTGVGINLRERSSDILVKGNHFHDLRQQGGDGTAGYGLRVSSPEVEISNLRVVGNRFERLGHDAMEFGGVDGLLVEGNEVSGVDIEPGSGAHADPLFIWAGSRRVTVRGNSFHDNSQPVYLRGGTEQVLFENNLVAGSDNWCMQVGGKGLPGDGIDGLVMRNNTAWDCDFGGILFSGPSPGWTFVNNVVQTLSAGPPTGRFDTQEFNLIGGRPRFVDPGAGDYRLAPGSPGIDAGTSVEAPARDRLGGRRSDDPSVRNRGAGPLDFYDVGAFERFVAPRLAGLRVPSGRGVPLIRYRLSVPARVRFTVAPVGGRRLGAFTDRSGRRGRNRVALPDALARRVGGGRYSLVARAVDAAGNRSKSVRAGFVVSRR